MIDWPGLFSEIHLKNDKTSNFKQKLSPPQNHFFLKKAKDHKQQQNHKNTSSSCNFYEKKAIQSNEN